MKISIIYGSTTGSTETVAGIISNAISNHDVEVVNVAQANDNHVKEADLVLLGSSTWGYGELQDDFVTYLDRMNEELYKGKSVAVFGCGDSISFSDVFCEAVNIISDKVTTIGGHLVSEPLKIDGDVNDHSDEIISFAKAL